VEPWDAGALSPGAGLRCPACAAAVRPDAPWCTLCYQDLRPAEPEVAVVVPTAPAVPGELAEPVVPAWLSMPTGGPYRGGVLDPLTAPAEALGLPAARASARAVVGDPACWPCGSCGSWNAFDLSACSGCGTSFLAGVRDGEGPLLELPVVGDLTALSRGQRLGLAAAVVLAVIVMTVVLSLIFS